MRLLTLMAMVAVPAMVLAAVKTRVVEYQHDGVTLAGFLAYDDAAKGPRPMVLVTHEWLGQTAYARKRAEQVAELGYVGFAVDMYGKGVLGKGPQEGAALAAPFKKDRAKMRARVTAALDVAKKQPEVDSTKVAAMGYCFGGTCSLELARSGAELKGVISFHGDLSAPVPAEAGKVTARVLAFHGADDPFVPPAQVTAFEDEMRKAKVDWQLVSFGNTVHSFTVPDAGTDNAKGAAYNADADRRSFQGMKYFLAEIFGGR